MKHHQHKRPSVSDWTSPTVYVLTSVHHIDRGYVFHRVGAADVNAWSALDFEKDGETSKTSWSAEMRAQEGWCNFVRSDKNSRASPFKDFQTYKRIVKSIVHLTGSQWCANISSQLEEKLPHLEQAEGCWAQTGKCQRKGNFQNVT